MDQEQQTKDRKSDDFKLEEQKRDESNNPTEK
jgi:hypothetical protein